MNSRYVKNAAIASYDPQVTQVAEKYRLTDKGRMVLAVENEAGQVYRVLFVDGPTRYLSVIEELTALGLADRMGPYSATSPEGYDNRFAAPAV